MLNSNIIKLKVSDYPIQNGRIDKWIIEAFSLLNSSYPEDLKVNTYFSRTKIKDLILSGNVKVDGIKNKNPAYKINPKNEIGKLTLIVRLGQKNIESMLPKLIEKVKQHGQNVTWFCDPMHGNTIRAKNGYKTRKFETIINEIRLFLFFNIKSLILSFLVLLSINEVSSSIF